MKTNKQTRHDAKQLFRSCMAGDVLDEARARQIASALVQSKPRGYLAVLSHFHRLVKLDTERRSARVETAAPLGQDLQDRVKQSLEKTYGPGLNMSFSQNSSLIGGMRVQVGSDVYDGSVRAKLAALQESFG